MNSRVGKSVLLVVVVAVFFTSFILWLSGNDESRLGDSESDLLISAEIGYSAENNVNQSAATREQFSPMPGGLSENASVSNISSTGASQTAFFLDPDYSSVDYLDAATKSQEFLALKTDPYSRNAILRANSQVMDRFVQQVEAIDYKAGTTAGLDSAFDISPYSDARCVASTFGSRILISDGGGYVIEGACDAPSSARYVVSGSDMEGVSVRLIGTQMGSFHVISLGSTGYSIAYRNDATGPPSKGATAVPAFGGATAPELALTPPGPTNQ